MKSPRPFSDYQSVLLDEGMAISADCTHESYGNIIYNEIGTDSSLSLSAWTKKQVIKALQESYQNLNLAYKNSREPKMSQDEYSRFLVSEFDKDKEFSPGLCWVEPDNPWSGLISRQRGNIWSYFDVKVSPLKMKTAWDGLLHVDVDAKVDEKIRAGIDHLVEEIYDYKDPSLSDREKEKDWVSMCDFGEVVAVYSGLSNKIQKIVFAYKKNILSPILDNYAAAELYIASPDTVYFTIGRPHFHLILAGERLDSSYEITIFEALNE